VLAARRRPPVTELLPLLSLALVTCLIAFNKVGSPQFMSWLAVPVLFGLVTAHAGGGRSFRSPAIIAAVIGALTQAIYPYLYADYLSLDGQLLIAGTIRNILILVLFGWAVHALWELWRGGDWPEEDRLDEDALPVATISAGSTVDTWPFERREHGRLDEHP
jgi:hypothetical protein